MRLLSFVSWIVASLASCSVPIADKDRCLEPQDCVRNRVCIDGRCMDPAPPLDAPLATADVPEERAPAALAADAPLDGPASLDAPDDQMPSPPDGVTDLAPEALVCTGGCPGSGCSPGSSCCPACPQGCQNGNCRIDITGDDWTDYHPDGSSAGHTLSIRQVAGQFAATYTSGPRQGLGYDLVFTDWNRILLGGSAAGEVRSRNLIVLLSGEWRR
jgi:hypothetical protein